jgi:hypothetical protein
MVAAGGIILAAGATFLIFGQSMTHGPKPAGTPGTAGGTDVAFVTQAATRTLQQRTVDLVVSVSGTAGGASSTVHGTGAFDLAGKAGTLNMTVDAKTGSLAIREIFVNGYVYLGMSVKGVDLMPKGKAWIAEHVPAQGAGTTNLAGGDPTAGLAALESQGSTVRALGTKVVGGVSCTGYAVTPPGAQGTSTVWIDQQHLVRELSVDATVGLPAAGASASAAPTGTAAAGSLELTMDLSYSATPVHVTAPPAASTISFADFLGQLGQSPAIRQLEPSPGAS